MSEYDNIHIYGCLCCDGDDLSLYVKVLTFSFIINGSLSTAVHYRWGLKWQSASWNCALMCALVCRWSALLPPTFQTADVGLSLYSLTGLPSKVYLSVTLLGCTDTHLLFSSVQPHTQTWPWQCSSCNTVRNTPFCLHYHWTALYSGTRTQGAIGLGEGNYAFEWAAGVIRASVCLSKCLILSLFWAADAVFLSDCSSSGALAFVYGLMVV